PGHVPYAEANGLWNNRGLIGKNKLDQYWKPHLEGKKDFDSAATELLQAL
ncbi:MAG: hypothetical protein JOZ22_14265, partial [Acidobacteriia bacterium]|nr:hypothetical protein [Terriglobia bacterium]